jgi:hypothetical protein
MPFSFRLSTEAEFFSPILPSFFYFCLTLSTLRSAATACAAACHCWLARICIHLHRDFYAAIEPIMIRCAGTAQAQMLASSRSRLGGTLVSDVGEERSGWPKAEGRES